MKSEERDYSKLEGKIIKWIGYKEYTGYIAGCDPDIGITIVNAEDHSDYLTCINGPMAPKRIGNPKDKTTSYWLHWEENFKLAVSMIQEGVWEVDRWDEQLDKQMPYNHIARLFKSNPSVESCPFSQ